MHVAASLIIIPIVDSSRRPTIQGLLESALYVKDVERSIRFYADLFAFEPLARDDRFCALNVADRTVLLLFERGSKNVPDRIPGGVIPPHDGGGTLHLAFAIDTQELPGWEALLREKGIEVESKVRWECGGTSLYFRDPDDHLVELATPGLWSIY